MFVLLRVQGFESSVNKVFQNEKLVNSKTIIYSPHLKELVQQELILHLLREPKESEEDESEKGFSCAPRLLKTMAFHRSATLRQDYYPFGQIVPSLAVRR
jgi:hypothetical protein